MTDYKLLTVWQFEAPLARVYAAVCDPAGWPAWWPDAQRVEPGHRGEAGGVGQSWRCSWRGRMPYRLVFDIVTTRVQPLVAVEGRISGDLEGTGRCLFSQQGSVTTVEHHWDVRTTRPWMNLLAPVARPLFKRNHALAMERAGEQLARRLAVRRLGWTHTDLRAPDQDRVADRLAAVGSGIAAGVLATAVQIALWLLAEVPVAETLWRDIRLTAALVAGPEVLASPQVRGWQVAALATAVHFLLAAVYGLVLARLIGRLPAAGALAAGGQFGLALYIANLHGFAMVFPWFAVARGWITCLTHVAFGLILAASYLALRSAACRGAVP